MVQRIIVEGADQQGKSTLCKFLSDKLGFNVVHFGKPSEDFDYIKDYLVPPKTICDRSFLSEVVYSKIIGRHCLAPQTLLCNILEKQNTLVILLDRGDDFVFDSTRKEDYTEKEIRATISWYRLVFNQIEIRNKMKLNPNSPLYNSIIEQIVIDIQNGNL